MHSHRLEPQQICEEISVFVITNILTNFLILTRYFGDKHRLMQRKLNSFVYLIFVNRDVPDKAEP